MILNNTDLHIPTLGIGGSHLGSVTDTELSKKMLDQWKDYGYNLIDTAHIYGSSSNDVESPSERLIGQWMKERKCRNNMIVVTKGGHPNTDPVSMSFGPSRVLTKNLCVDLEMSLKSLQTDYIDIYLLHRDDTKVPVEEIIDFLENKAREGKIKYYGCSNWSVDRMLMAQKYAEGKNYKGFICNQVPAGLAHIESFFSKETGMARLDKNMEIFHKESQMAVMPVMALANGYFHKRIAANGQALTGWPADIYNNSVNEKILPCLMKFINEGYSINSILLKYVMSYDFQSVPIIGFSNLNQMNQILDDMRKDIPKEIIEELTELKSSLIN